MKLIILALCAAAAAAAFDDVNINTATKQQLDDLWQVGPSTAKKIRVYRDAFGPFASVEDLADVSGLSSNDVSQMLVKAGEGKNALPVVVPCPMSCEMKVVATRNHTVPVMHMTHNSNNATVGAHGPHVRHASCTDSVGRCADSQVIKHTCRALTKTALGEAVTETRRADQCACFCWHCTDKHNTQPCDSVNNICGKDTSGHKLVYKADRNRCEKCGSKRGEPACVDSQGALECDATDEDDSTIMLTVNGLKCTKCGRDGWTACGGTACDALASDGTMLHVNDNGKCAKCGQLNKNACGGTTCANGLAADTSGKCRTLTEDAAGCGGWVSAPCVFKYLDNDGCSNTSTLAVQDGVAAKCWACGGNNQMPCKLKYTDNQGCGPGDELAKGGDAVNHPNTMGQHHGYNTVNPNPHPAGKCHVCGGNNQPKCDTKWSSNGGCKPGTRPGATTGGTYGKCWDNSDCGGNDKFPCGDGTWAGNNGCEDGTALDNDKCRTCGSANGKWPCPNKYLHNGGCSNSTTLAVQDAKPRCWTCGGANQMPCKFKYSDNQGCGPGDELAKGGDAVNHPNTMGQHHGYNTVNPNPHPAGKCHVCGGDNEPRCDTKYAVNNGCKPNHSGTHHQNKCWACTRANVAC